MTTTTAYALKIATSVGGDDVETVGVFATSAEAADHYVSRNDLRGYFWTIRQEDVAPDEELPCVFWSEKKVAAALAAQEER
jgi:hypothetical protein